MSRYVALMEDGRQVGDQYRVAVFVDKSGHLLSALRKLEERGTTPACRIDSDRVEHRRLPGAVHSGDQGHRPKRGMERLSIPRNVRIDRLGRCRRLVILASDIGTILQACSQFKRETSKSGENPNFPGNELSTPRRAAWGYSVGEVCTISKLSSARSNDSGRMSAWERFRSTPRSASISLSTAREVVPVRARSGGGCASRSAPSLRKLFDRLRCAGRKSCPHSETQCASSMTAKLSLTIFDRSKNARQLECGLYSRLSFCVEDQKHW